MFTCYSGILDNSILDLIVRAKISTRQPIRPGIANLIGSLHFLDRGCLNNYSDFMNAASEKTPTHFDSLEQQAFLNLWRTYDRLRMLEDECFAAFELTAQQYNVLRLLKARQPEAAATLEVAERLVSKAPDITRMLDKLEARQLIHRERSTADRRTVHVTITSGGLDLLKTIAPALRACHVKQLGHLSATDLKKAVDLLKAMRLPHESPTSSWR